MNWADILSGLGRITKQFNVLVERVDRLERGFDQISTENRALRQEVSSLTEGIATLEEARKTTAVEVKLALIETISAWENQKLRDEINKLKQGQIPPHRRVDDGRSLIAVYVV